MDYVNFKQNEDFQVLLTLEEIIPLTLLGKEKKSKSLKKKIILTCVIIRTLYLNDNNSCFYLH